MKRTKLFGLLVLAALYMATVSCEKAAELSETDILSVEWKVDKVIIDGVKDESKNYSNYLFTFNRDLSYIFTEAPTEKVELEGSWILSEDNKFLHLTGSSGTEIAVPLNKLTEENAELVFTIPATFKSPEKTAIFFLIRN